MENEERKPWDQMVDEPDAAYRRFLVYLGLGPGRSIEKAIEAEKGIKRQNGQWYRDSSNYRWKERTAAYDIAMLAPQMGSEVVINWTAAANEWSKNLLEAIQGGKMKPKNFDQTVTLFNVFANFVTPETLEAAKSFIGGNFGRDDLEPEEGTEKEL
jgi:hypothetical protein